MRGIGPWFHRWPRASLVVAGLLFAGIFALRMTTGSPSEATTMFFVLPIALLAITFGLVGGLAGGLIAVGLVVAWAIAEHAELSAVGWATRVVPMLLLGVLLGHAVDRLRRSEAERARLDKATGWHRQAVELNDSIVQGLAVAKWSLERGNSAAALQIITETLDDAHAMVSELLRNAGLERGGPHASDGVAALSNLRKVRTLGTDAMKIAVLPRSERPPEPISGATRSRQSPHQS
jgi:hypothetical protein